MLHRHVFADLYSCPTGPTNHLPTQFRSSADLRRIVGSLGVSQDLACAYILQLSVVGIASFCFGVVAVWLDGRTTCGLCFQCMGDCVLRTYSGYFALTQTAVSPSPYLAPLWVHALPLSKSESSKHPAVEPTSGIVLAVLPYPVYHIRPARPMATC